MNASAPDRSADGHSRIISGLNESLAELREMRDKTRKNALTISAVIVAVTILLSAGLYVVSGDLLMFVLILGIILAISTYIGMMRGVKLKYKKLVVPSLLKDIDPGLAYNPNGCIPKEEFRRAKIFSTR